MARIKLEFPLAHIYTTQIRIRVDDINNANHVGNQQILVFCQETRSRFIKSIGEEELSLYGVGLIQADAAVVYKAEIFLGDILTAELAIVDFTNVSFDFMYRLKNQNNKLVALAKTGMVCYDYKNKIIQSVPEAFKLQFSNKA